MLTWSFIKLGTVKTQSDITWFCTLHCIEQNINQNLFVELTIIPYLALMGKLWGFYCEDFGENLLYYNDTALCFFSLSGLVSLPNALLCSPVVGFVQWPGAMGLNVCWTCMLIGRGKLGSHCCRHCWSHLMKPTAWNWQDETDVVSMAMKLAWLTLST